MHSAYALNEAPPRRGRLQLLLILFVVIGPMVLATAMYQWRFWVPDGRNYHGELLGDGQSRASLGVQGDDRHWQLLVTAPQGCAEDCRQLVYLARQINIGLGRDADRGSHALASAQPLDEAYASRLRREYPQLQRYPLDPERYRQAQPDGAAQLWIVDPHGNLVLRYGAGANGKSILNDLRLLLKISRIG